MRRRWMLGCLAIAAALLVILGLWIGPVVVDAARAGFLDRSPTATYSADREGNLRAMYTALDLFHRSEERFPEAETWMDDIANRLRTTNMSESDAAKKLRRPNLTEGYGYAINPEVAGRFRDDLQNPNAILIFESSLTGRNASEPVNPNPDAWAVTVTGEIGPISSLRKPH